MAKCNGDWPCSNRDMRRSSASGILLGQLLDQIRVSDRASPRRCGDGAAFAGATAASRDASSVDRHLAREDGRPADDVELVHIAETMDVAAGVEQRAHRFKVPSPAAQCSGVGVVSGIARVRIGAVLKQQAHGVRLTALRRGVQAVQPWCCRGNHARGPGSGRLSGAAAAASISPFGAGLEELSDVIVCRCSTRLQRTPARESVIARDREQGSRELRGGSARRNTCSRSFASFFRYSSEARSGS